MVYNPAADFVGLWRLAGGQVSKLEMPGLDFVVAAFARAGLITLSVSATAPLVNQSTTAWLQAAVPSYNAEGVLRLWNAETATYVAATPALFLKMLQAAATQNGVSWYTTTLGPPANVVGNNGDFAIRTDEPGGIYGPKAGGAWPAIPLPGTLNEVSSATLDNSFGGVLGNMIYRDVAAWEALGIGGAGNVLVSLAGIPAWQTLLSLFDLIFSSVQGSVLYRGAAGWAALGPGLATQVLSSGGAAADPSWATRTPEFVSGTTMIFQQTAAPTGWTKQTTLNDYGLRVTSGAVGSVAGSGFSAVFAQTTVGNHTITTTEMPSHTHNISNFPLQIGDGTSGGGLAYSGSTPQNTGATGGGAAHSHSVNLTLSYVDVIIASKN